MADLKLIKSWKVTEALLERAKRALPEPTAENKEEYQNLLSKYRQFLEHNELELALDILEELGGLVHCRGGFWRDLERAAENMNLKDRVPKLRKKFSEAVAASNEKTSS